MPARASVTVSPSSSRIRRSTPWVEGCCGPMLTTTRSSASSPRPSEMESQSWPVTVKTRPAEVSAPGSAKRSCSPPVAAPASPVVPWLPEVRGHQLYALRWSGGGTVPPLYSTGMPPSG